MSASRCVETPSRHRRDSCPSHHEVGGFFFEFEAVRTEPRCSAQVFRPDKNQTMFSNSEAFAVAKANFVKLVGQVEPVADRIA